jgi:hypothetical protein
MSYSTSLHIMIAAAVRAMKDNIPRTNHRVIRASAVALGLSGVLIATDSLSADSRTITLERSSCDLLVRHVPTPDVAYQAGVDVEGRPVVPADLDPSWTLELPAEIPIYISQDLVQRFGIGGDSPLFEADAFIGIATVGLIDGHVTFNGRELVSAEEQALAAQCRAATKPR